MPALQRVVYLVLFAILCLGGAATAQDLREMARRHARTRPGVPMELPAPPGDYRPKSIEALTREADVVLRATLTRIGSYLSSKEDRVLTDYTITSPRVIAGRLPVLTTRTPGESTRSPVLTVWGGEVRIEGVWVRGTDGHRDPIENDVEYLLFLRPARMSTPGHYEIDSGGIFEVTPDALRPLLKRGDQIFPEFVEAPPREILERVAGTVKSPQAGLPHVAEASQPLDHFLVERLAAPRRPRG